MATVPYTTEFSVVMLAGETTITLTENTDYFLSGTPAEEDCLVWLIDSRHTGMGETVGGGNQSPMEHRIWIGASTDVINTIVLRRNNVTLTKDCRITIGIVQITDTASNSRFWMRQRGVVSFAAGDTAVDGPAAPSSPDAVVDPGRVWVNIAAQQTDSTNRGQAHTGLFTSVFEDGIGKFTRGNGTTYAGKVSFQIIEFGSDWKDVQRLEFDSDSIGASFWDYTDITPTNTPTITGLGGDALTDISRAFLECQFRVADGGNQGNDDRGEAVSLTDVDELTVRKSTTNLDASKHHVVWIMEWDGPAGATPPVAQHIAYMQEGVTNSGFYTLGNVEGSEEGVVTVTITEVTDLNNASCVGLSSSSDGTNLGTPRGLFDARVATTTTVVATRSETGKWEWRTLIVWQWPAGLDAAETYANHRTEISSAGSAAAALAGAGSERAELASAGSAAAGISIAGSERAELRQAGSAGSAIRSL